MNKDASPPDDDSLGDFLQSQAAMGPGHASREREQRKREQAELKRRLFYNRVRAVAIISSGAAIGVMSVGVVAERDSVRLVKEVLVVLFGGPFFGLAFAMGAMHSAAQSDLRSDVADQLLKRGSRDSQVPYGPWRTARFLVFAGPVVMSWIATKGHAPSFQAGILGAIGAAVLWHFYNRRHGEYAPFA